MTIYGVVKGPVAMVTKEHFIRDNITTTRERSEEREPFIFCTYDHCAQRDCRLTLFEIIG